MIAHAPKSTHASSLRPPCASLLVGLALLTPGCGELVEGLGAEELIEQCGLRCEGGVLEGKSTITGIAEFDLFFAAAIDLGAASHNVGASLRAHLDATALSVGLPAGATGAQIAAAVDARFTAATQAGLTIQYAPPVCSASVEIAASAAAECSAEVDPGSIEIACEGACEVEGGIDASCEADATLVCTGVAPDFACAGSCSGSCELNQPNLSCEGTCRGTCEGECSVRDSQDNCAGACMGSCQGSCELAGGGSCEGDCTGECTYTPASGGCEANASATCEAEAGASVMCEGKCEGSASPPNITAECEATVEAKANASVECTPPALELSWQWSAEFDGQGQAMVQAEFRAWLVGFKLQLAGILAAQAKAELLVEALDGLAGSGSAALDELAATLLDEGSVVSVFKLGACGLPALTDTTTLLFDASNELQAEVVASAELMAVVGI